MCRGFCCVKASSILKCKLQHYNNVLNLRKIGQPHSVALWTYCQPSVTLRIWRRTSPRHRKMLQNEQSNGQGGNILEKRGTRSSSLLMLISWRLQLGNYRSLHTLEKRTRQGPDLIDEWHKHIQIVNWSIHHWRTAEAYKKDLMGSKKEDKQWKVVKSAEQMCSVRNRRQMPWQI